jgi:single-stranded-DNA-specific exonuclease
VPDYSFKGFIQNLMGIIKHFMNKRLPFYNIEDFVTKLCVEDTLLIAGLKYLKAVGKINYYLDIEEGRIVFKEEKAIDKYNLKIFEVSLKNALLEKEAYREFILKLRIEDFKKYLQ